MTIDEAMTLAATQNRYTADEIEAAIETIEWALRHASDRRRKGARPGLLLLARLQAIAEAHPEKGVAVLNLNTVFRREGAQHENESPS